MTIIAMSKNELAVGEDHVDNGSVQVVTTDEEAVAIPLAEASVLPPHQNNLGNQQQQQQL